MDGYRDGGLRGGGAGGLLGHKSASGGLFGCERLLRLENGVLTTVTVTGPSVGAGWPNMHG